MPFPYVTPDALARELPFGPGDFPALGENEWPDLLDDKLEQESERIESWTGESWRPDDADVPFVIQAATIRLTRNALDQIETDGYESDEDGWSYRSPEQVREEVRVELGEAGYDTGNVASLSVPSVR